MNLTLESCNFNYMTHIEHLFGSWIRVISFQRVREFLMRLFLLGKIL